MAIFAGLVLESGAAIAILELVAWLGTLAPLAGDSLRLANGRLLLEWQSRPDFQLSTRSVAKVYMNDGQHLRERWDRIKGGYVGDSGWQ